MSDIFCFAECDIRLRRVIYECRDNSRHSCDIPLRGIEEDFAFAKSTNLPPHPSRFARHLPRHGKADRLASADNRGEDNKAILFLCFYSFTFNLNRLLFSIILLYCLSEYAALLKYRLAEYVALLYCLADYDTSLKIIAFSPSVDGSSDNSSLPMSGKVAREARRMRR